MILAILLLFSGLAISAVAIYYSVVGLTAIFAAAAIPIMIMGVSLEVGKLVIASWVKAYWARIPILMRTYAVFGVVVLMIITSLGIFGFLSKAHSDQTLVSGDVQSKIAIYDEKIKTAKDNIDANRRALKQMDEAVDQSMARSADEKGAANAVAIRRGQQKERQRLQSEITTEQTRVNQLLEERAPIAAEVRKVEAEVGPIKYIAAFVYGDNPDSGILERAVTWVIILIVIVFDPLAVVMLLAAQMTWTWYKNPEQDKYDHIVADGSGITVDELVEQAEEDTPVEVNKHTQSLDDGELPDYLNQHFAHFGNLQPMPAPQNDPELKLETTPFDTVPGADDKTLITDNSIEVSRLQSELNESQGNMFELANYVQTLQQDYSSVSELHQKSMTREADLIEELAQLKAQLEDQAAMAINPEPEDVELRPFTEEEIMALDGRSVDERLAEGEAVSITEMPTDFREMISQGIESGELVVQGAAEHQEESASVVELAPDTQPEILTLGIDTVERPGDYITDPVANLFTRREPKTGFGNNFPDNPNRGDLFLRTDFRPSRLFKWNDKKWIEVNKSVTDAYAYNDVYIQFLAEQVLSGTYTYDDLTETEQEQVQTLIGGYRG